MTEIASAHEAVVMRRAIDITFSIVLGASCLALCVWMALLLSA
ncbi:MAG TPA: hypothetical protein VMW17_23780 [Candidatus Binatia bacterium]|nr:hypothetical protein [Candidatus Binatia bacterium]